MKAIEYESFSCLIHLISSQFSRLMRIPTTYLSQIYSGLSGLGVLEGAFDVVVFAVFDEVGAGLFEPGGYLFFFADAAEFHLPVEVAGAGLVAGFAACYYLFYPLAYV